MKSGVVNSPGQSPAFKTALRWLAGASTLIYACSRFMPCAPPIRGELTEDSWMQILHHAFVHHLQFGRDVVFTFGPWGFLYGGYLPETHRLSAFIWLLLSVVFWWTAGKVARHFTRNEFISWAWLLGFTGVAGLRVFQNIDVCLHAFVVLLLLLYFFVEDRPLSAAQTALVACLGLVGLTKFSLLPETVMLLALISADIALRRRKFPWIAVVFVAAVLCFWLAASQQLGSLWPFLKNSSAVAGGFTEAMMMTGPDEPWDILCFLACAALVCGLAGRAAWMQRGPWGLLPAAGLVLTLFFGFKYGYVRHDGHELAAVLELLLVSLAVMAVGWPVFQSRGKKWAPATLFPAMLVFVFASVTFSHHSETGLVAGFVRTFGVQDLFAPVELPFNGDRLREDHSNHLAEVRARWPLPPVKGTIDAYPFNQAALFANGLDYRPRPVFHSYSAYTPELGELNAAFLRGDHAPDFIYFQMFNLDDHFPSLDDGLSWPELLARYDVQNLEPAYALLKRSPNPRTWRLTPLADVAVRFGERVAIPATNGLVWAKITIEPTVAGAMATALFRGPVVWMTVTVQDGRAGRRRLVPGMARAGFLLSPVVQNGAQFLRLASPDAQAKPSGNEVASIMITAGDGDGQTVCYRSPMQLQLYRIEFSPPGSGR